MRATNQKRNECLKSFQTVSKQNHDKITGDSVQHKLRHYPVNKAAPISQVQDDRSKKLDKLIKNRTLGENEAR